MLNVLFAASLIAAAAASDQLAAGVLPKTILVAVATANTGGNLVKQLSLEGKVDIKAAVRSRDDVRATELAALPRVTVVVLDFDDVATVSAALAGVDRAFLVSARLTICNSNGRRTFWPWPVQKASQRSGSEPTQASTARERRRRTVERTTASRHTPTLTASRQ